MTEVDSEVTPVEETSAAPAGRFAFRFVRLAVWGLCAVAMGGAIFVSSAPELAGSMASALPNSLFPQPDMEFQRDCRECHCGRHAVKDAVEPSEESIAAAATE